MSNTAATTAVSGAPTSTSSSPVNRDIQRLLSNLQSNTDTNDDSTRPSKRSRNIVLTPAQFNEFLQTINTQHSPQSSISGQGSTATGSTSASVPAYYSNAKYEEISCKGIKPLNNGSEEGLIPFLNKLDLRRQNEGWSPATYITIAEKRYDLTTHVTLLNESHLKSITESQWTIPSVDQDKHTIGHVTYNACLLAMVILNSVTDDFMTTLIHRVPTLLRNDGTYLLWSVCHNIHRNNVAFHEHTREKIRVATVLDHGNDVSNYIIGIKNHLKMITPLSGTTEGENGLLTYILHQLKACPIPMFQEYIRKIHVSFQEGKHPDMTPMTLLADVKDNIWALKHAAEWLPSLTPSPSAMALVTSSSSPSTLEDLLRQQTALIGKLLEGANKGSKNSYHEWKFKAPANLQDIHRHNGKVFRWCTKCNGGQGQWASAHDTATHLDGFRQERGRSANNPRHQRSGNPRCDSALQAQADSDQPGPPEGNQQTPHAMTSDRANLATALESSWRFDVSDDLMD